MNGAAHPGRALLEVVNTGFTTMTPGDAELVAAPEEDHRIVLLGYAGSCEADNELDFRSASDPLAGPLPVAGRQALFAFQREGLGACEPGAPLVLNVAQPGLVSLFITYAIEKA